MDAVIWKSSLVAALEWTFSIFKGQLYYCMTATAANTSFCFEVVVSESLLQTAPSFESMIDHLMPSKILLFGSSIGP
jgi:hypothetical protein